MISITGENIEKMINFITVINCNLGRTSVTFHRMEQIIGVNSLWLLIVLRGHPFFEIPDYVIRTFLHFLYGWWWWCGLYGWWWLSRLYVSWVWWWYQDIFASYR